MRSPGAVDPARPAGTADASVGAARAGCQATAWKRRASRAYAPGTGRARARGRLGAAWLMTSLTPSPVLVALMQTAASLPVFLLGLPAGAMADVVDRRRLLLVAQAWMLLAAAALGVLTLLGATTAWALLGLTFA